MKIYGLSGKSGTGKSYNAIDLCKKRGIPAIIDDGLYIFESSVTAGISAKKQNTKIGAIKTALFTDDGHANSVGDAIVSTKPSSILVLGTSDKMIDQICERLCLPVPSEYLHIEDILTKEQIARARELRSNAGMHTIPAPSFELKKRFSGYFLVAPRRIKVKYQQGKEEKTIVRPTYSYLGSYEASDKVIEDIASYMIRTTPGAASLLFSSCSKDDSGMYVRIFMLCRRGFPVLDTVRLLQKKISEAVAMTTAYNVVGVDIVVRGFK